MLTLPFDSETFNYDSPHQGMFTIHGDEVNDALDKLQRYDKCGAISCFMVNHCTNFAACVLFQSRKEARAYARKVEPLLQGYRDEAAAKVANTANLEEKRYILSSHPQGYSRMPEKLMVIPVTLLRSHGKTVITTREVR